MREGIEAYHRMLLDVYDQQRRELFRLRKEKSFSDEEIRKTELQLDVNELKITGQLMADPCKAALKK